MSRPRLPLFISVCLLSASHLCQVQAQDQKRDPAPAAISQVSPDSSQEKRSEPYSVVKAENICPNSYGHSYVSRKSPLNSPFWHAISDGDIKTLEALLTDDFNLNFTVDVPSDMPNQKGSRTTPLLHAIVGGHFKMVEFLLQRGADVNFHPAGGISALHAAAWAGNLEILKALLERKASLEERSQAGDTPLLLGAENSEDPAVVKDLIAAGANIHAKDNAGDTAIKLAAWQHHIETVKFLIKLGGDACAKDNDGKTAIDDAQSKQNEDPGKQELIALLQQKCGP
jgi:ankyrin repeat protein